MPAGPPTPGQEPRAPYTNSNARLFQSLFDPAAVDEMVKGDLEFARFLVARELATPSQVRECLEEQGTAVREGVQPPPRLQSLLIRRKILTPAQLVQARESWESVPADVPAPGDAERIGPYVRLEKIGSGGMGEVWKAWDTVLGRPVALKFLKAVDPDDLARFRREAELAAKLSHPNIAAIYEMGAGGARPYLAMQFVEGSTFDRVSKRDPKLLARLFRDAARALDHAHKLGIIHRDIKPSNVMVSGEGNEGLRVVLLDFGLARRIEGGEKVTASGLILGTPAYMSPEQARGDGADRRSDVYGLGATMYEVLTSQPPFQDDHVIQLLKKVESDEPRALRRLNRAVDADLETIVLTCLEKEPSRRYRSAGALADDLDRYLEGEPILAKAPGVLYRLRKKLAKRKAVAALATLAILLAGSAALLGQRATSAEARAQSELRKQTQTALLAVMEVRRAGRTERLQPFVDRTREACREAISLLPRKAEPHYRLGRMYRAVMDDVRALEEQSRALEKEPDYAPALYERSVLLAKQYRRHLQELWKSAFALEGKQLADRGELKPGMKNPVPKWRQVVHSEAQARHLMSRLSMDLAKIEGSGGELSEGERLCARGLMAWAKWDEKEAIHNLSSALRASPGLEEGYEALASLHEEGERYEQSVRVWTQGYEQDRGYTPHLLGRSFAQLNWGLQKREQGEDPTSMFEGTVRDSTEALDRSDALAQAWRWRGAARINWGFYREMRGEDPTELYEAGVRDYNEALVRSPRDAELWCDRGLARSHSADRAARRGDDPTALYRGAGEDFDQALKLNEKDAETWSRRGSTEMRMANFMASRGEDATGSYRQAIEDLGRSLELSPAIAKTWKERGYARSNAGLFTMNRGEDPTRYFRESIEDYSESLRQDPADSDGWTGRGGARVNWGLYKGGRGEDPTAQYEAAVTDFGEGLKRNPESVKAWQWRGRARSNLGNVIRQSGGDPSEAFRGAIEDFDQAQRRNPSDGEIPAMRGGTHVNWGNYLSNIGKDPLKAYEQALHDFDRALTLNRNQPVLWHFRGNAYFGRARYKVTQKVDAVPDYREAMNSYQEAIRLNPRMERNLRSMIEECKRQIND